MDNIAELHTMVPQVCWQGPGEQGIIGGGGGGGDGGGIGGICGGICGICSCENKYWCGCAQHVMSMGGGPHGGAGAHGCWGGPEPFASCGIGPGPFASCAIGPCPFASSGIGPTPFASCGTGDPSFASIDTGKSEKRRVKIRWIMLCSLVYMPTKNDAFFLPSISHTGARAAKWIYTIWIWYKQIYNE